ncbi:MAG: PAS domain S-box protein [Burkholderiales bacterium]|nr:PAS domain S-box protein [Burkholderiales bacterium]
MSHVLIVEDHEENRNLLKLLLEVNGYRVSAAGDGLEALESARRDRPDIIVSDALMPNMDGFALCRAWMQDAQLKAIPFVFYSATYVRPDDQQFAAALGAVRYLIKPLEAKAFLAELEAVLQHWAGRAAPAPAAPLDPLVSHALHESTLARKLEDKMAQLEAANRSLQESEARFRSLTEMSSDFYWESDTEHRLIRRASANEKVSTVSVFARGAHIGERRWEISYLSPDEAGWAAHRAMLEAHQPFRDFVLSRAGADGRERFISISGDPVYDAAGAFLGYRGVGTDITERKRANDELRAAEEQYRGLVEQSIAGSYVIQDGKFVYLNRRCAEIFGYGSPEELIGRNSTTVIAEKDHELHLENVRRRIEGEIESINYEFTGLCKDGSMIDVGVHGARATHKGRPAIIGLIQDISEKKRAEDEIKRYVAQLETAFMSTVQVATTLGEMRDPYTAGHQRKVAEIAVAIGAELGFDARRQEGLRVSGYLHDIGKITIPAEILSKPGKLSATEYRLVQGHAQASYDVLKDVQFPWPVAEVARQHHERVDGSGYPQGLKGEAILFEARIMAVADVVEAMSTHRPYRPGMGMEAALAEIERGRGSAYDAEVADACLRLYRDKRHPLPE